MGCGDRQIDTETETEKQTGRQAGRQAGRQVGRQVGRLAERDRQTNTERHRRQTDIDRETEKQISVCQTLSQ